MVIVSGDLTTPHDEVYSVLDVIASKYGLETAYIVTDDTRTSHVVPMRSIQRRNVAILEAINRSADMITTIDTDNFPLNDTINSAGIGYFNSIERLFAVPYTHPVVGSSTGWANVGTWCYPSVTYRGWPIGQQSNAYYHTHSDDRLVKVGVHSSLWLGDPDISALERLLKKPEITEVPDITIVLEPSIWCPFNSQATTYRRELLPLLNVWPGVGRMDDIWPSYVARHIMDHLDYTIAYGAPNVRQERHEHDVVTDLENEIIGYRHTRTLLDAITAVNLAGIDDALDALDVMLTALNANRSLDDVIQPITRTFWRAWISDLRDMQL